MTLLKTIAVLLLMAGGLIFFIQRSMIFPVPDVTLPNRLPSGVEYVSLTEGFALLLPPFEAAEAPAPILIYAHGNATSVVWLVEQMEQMREAGFFVLLLEYPGYSGAAGKPYLKSIERSSLEAYDKVVARNDIDASRVVAYGRSIGGGAACLIAKQRPVAALGLESSFTRLADLVAEKGFPAFLLRDRFDNESVVRNLDAPVFLYHGFQDDLIPVHHSAKLSEAAKTHEFFQAECGHNNCPLAWTALLEFLDNKNVL